MMATARQIEAAARTRKPDLDDALNRDIALTVHRDREPPREFHDAAEEELLTVRPYAAAAQRLAQAGDALCGSESAVETLGAPGRCDGLPGGAAGGAERLTSGHTPAEDVLEERWRDAQS